MPNEPTATNAAPAAPASAPRKQVAAFNAKKAFEGTSAVDRMKQYLKDVPVLHARLTQVIAQQEAQLAASKKSLLDFDQVTAQIKATVAKWEEEQSHGRPGNAPVPAEPAAPAGAVADPAAGPAAPTPPAGAPGAGV